MSKFSFTDPSTGQLFSVNAPAGVSFEQAEAIFKQQLNTGSLTGVGVGQALSSATQAAGGLKSALSTATQNLASLTNKLPAAANLNTITKSLGPGGLAAAAQTQTSLIGQAFPAATNAINSLPSLATPGIAPTALINSITAPGSALTGAAAAIGSLANNAVTNIASALQTPVSNGIGIADLVKQGTNTGLPNLSATNVQAAMSQVSRLVNQASGVVSNSQGVGKFGLDVPQLEKAGYVKPGTSANFGSSDITSVLNSSSVWTGKDGVKNLNGILSNQTLQNDIQKNLMGQGLAALKTVGVPVDSLNPQAIAGLATNAAKSIDSTLKNLQGGAGLSLAQTADFKTLMRSSAYAVNFAGKKVNPAILGEAIAYPAENTVNGATLVAAAKRIVGNDKVPSVVPDIP